MKLRSKSKDNDTQHWDILDRRAKTLDDSELLEHIEIFLSNMCRYVPEYRKKKDALFLKEMEICSRSMLRMTEELLSRIETEPPAVKPARHVRDWDAPLPAKSRRPY
jgi:hypothetical protein